MVNVTWRCDCRLLWLTRLEQTAALTSSQVAPPFLAACAAPRHLTDTPLRDVPFHSLRCPVFPGCEEGELSHVQCQWCPPFQKPATSGECQCMEGHETVGQSCQPCPVGFHKTEVSSGQGCVRCPSNSSTLTVGAAACLCHPGYSQGLHGACRPCAENTFKSKLGNYPCLPCPLGSQGPSASDTLDRCSCQGDGAFLDSNLMECVALHGADGVVPRQKGVTAATAKVSGRDDTGGQLTFPNSVGVVVAVVVGVVVVVSLLTALVLSLLCAKRLPCRKPQDFCVDSADSTRHLLELTIETNLVSHNAPDAALHIRRLRVGRLLGRGAFGQVHHGVLCVCQHDVKKTMSVAVKKLKDKVGEEESRVLQEELEQMLLVGPHPNIIQLLGSCVYQGQLHIIMELAEEGDLLTHLRHGKLRHEQYVSVGPDGTLSEQKAVQVTSHAQLMLFAWHLAKGMSHLESVKCIHRDLAARNCLLTQGPVAKLSDFGLSRDVYENGYYLRHSKQGRVPYKWLSPEALLWGQYSSKSDVWSYGILLWEIATFGGTPYSGIAPDRIADMHRARYRLPQPPACPDKLYRVMRCCWHEDPRKRPTFRTLCDVMEIFVLAAADTKYLDLQGQTRATLSDAATSPTSSSSTPTTTTTTTIEGAAVEHLNFRPDAPTYQNHRQHVHSALLPECLSPHLHPSHPPSTSAATRPSSRLSLKRPEAPPPAQAQLHYLTLAGGSDEEEVGEGVRGRRNGEGQWEIEDQLGEGERRRRTGEGEEEEDSGGDMGFTLGGLFDENGREGFEMKPLIASRSLVLDETGRNWRRLGETGRDWTRVGETGREHEALELKPMLMTRLLGAEDWSESCSGDSAALSLSLQAADWADGRHGDGDKNYTSGYSSSRSLAA